MNRPKILRPGESYTFAKYFELAYDIGDILADLDCRFDRTLLNLPKTDQVIPELKDVRSITRYYPKERLPLPPPNAIAT
ncbi:hypothetical protein [Allocoleopsis franciscana]|uniref:Uncharacterized protein n=1 Tax=Allocoleopsis franciscana PCC 7113 TaxID=1173027 RepID=K9WLG5_9CYAN|nr:hypothetical protein [Allocoleopsis franciscana]AFZ20604.1 hypothetical protein Mic7113_4943 [Allocoleopsis franciscana PCC 7113]